MKFCPVCDNLLVPKNQKLYCKACEKEYSFNGAEDVEEYKIVKTIKHDEEEVAPVIIKTNSEKISGEDRKAYEEFFTGGEADGY